MPFTVVATWVARAGHEDEVEQSIRGLVAPTLAEKGCLSYTAHRVPDDQRMFVLIEQYVDEAAYREHTGSDHFRVFATERGIPLLERRERMFCEPFG